MNEYIIFFILAIVTNLISYCIGRYYRNKHPDGELQVTITDEERKWELIYYKHPETLMSKKVVTFKVGFYSDELSE